jgi:hypothetical protein
MKRWLIDLDRILRGEATRPDALQGDALKIPLGGLLVLILLFTAIYGACMGLFSGFREGGPCYEQWLASVIKTPALYFLTLLVTVPSLYVFNALVGSRLGFPVVFRLLVASLAVNVAVLASLGPIVAFFSVSTTSYPFMFLLNVAVFAVSGGLGFSFMLQTLRRLSASRDAALPPLPRADVSVDSENPQPQSESSSKSVESRLLEETEAWWRTPSYTLDRRMNKILVWWMIVFGLVMAQMAWVLRPILGNPAVPFRWLCPRESNFLHAFWEALCNLLS